MPTGFGWDFKTQYQFCQWEHMEYQGRQYKDALYEKKGKIAYITLNRPEKRNAYNDGMFGDMLAGLHQANDDPEVKVVVIRGAGINFSAGHDLSSPKEEESPPVSPSLNPTVVDYYGFERRRCNKHEDIFNYPKPTIAQVHGYCIGAGEIVAAMCDITIAAEDAQFGARGFGRFVNGINNYPIYPIGSNKAYCGRMLPEISGKEAEQLGTVNLAVPKEKLDEEVNRWAEMLSLLPAEVFTLAKEWFSGMLDINGWGTAMRAHYGAHLMLQYIRFRPDEISLYKERRDRGLKGFVAQRAASATPKA
ncbi:MAG: hypothetical protein A3G93_12070 [Nitrospinae bacterium RIFCSPLOWO2_12_FULL_45_22]|nr:MAG: hypothetical protein A3G93_12070 [Nitrospinae bacterium RIFCSPLOWO2_12_FULL_45_22]